MHLEWCKFPNREKFASKDPTLPTASPLNKRRFTDHRVEYFPCPGAHWISTTALSRRCFNSHFTDGETEDQRLRTAHPPQSASSKVRFILHSPFPSRRLTIILPFLFIFKIAQFFVFCLFVFTIPDLSCAPWDLAPAPEIELQPPALRERSLSH